MNARSIFFASCVGVLLSVAATAHAQGGFEMRVGLDGVITEMQ